MGVERKEESWRFRREMPASFISRGLSNLHDISADEADQNHICPAWDHREASNHICHRNHDAVLDQQAVKRVEDAVVHRGRFVGFLSVDVHQVLGCGARHVQAYHAHCGLVAAVILGSHVYRGELNMPKRKWSGGPHRA